MLSKKILETLVSLQKQKILENLSGTSYLMTAILYRCGLRLNECLSLRIKDIDFDRKSIFVRQAKGKKDRSVPLPDSLRGKLRLQVKAVRAIHEFDLSNGFGTVYLPNALEKKYPNAKIQFA